MKKFECECGCVIGLNQVKRHQQGKEHLKRMEKLNKKKEEKILLEEMINHHCPHSVDGLIPINNCYECESCDYLLCKDCDDYNYFNNEFWCNDCIDKNNKINDKWNEIVVRRSHYLKQEEQDIERDLRIIQLTNISDKYLEWLID